MKYEELLKQTLEEKEIATLPYKIKMAQKDLEREIITLEQRICEQDLEVVKAKSKTILDLKAIITATNTKILLERELKMAQDLQEELF